MDTTYDKKSQIKQLFCQDESLAFGSPFTVSAKCLLLPRNHASRKGTLNVEAQGQGESGTFGLSLWNTMLGTNVFKYVCSFKYLS